ncbi:ABC transporter transmembrane domain-containing protein [Omnitrophica bacterium]|nr:ABC transporter transmembrane domain-containing protein [Candidatus Omnitrophota bacterium]
MSIYRRLLGYVKPYRKRLIFAGLAAQVTTLATSLLSVVTYIVLNGLQHKDEVQIDLPHVPFLHGLHFPVFWIPFIIVSVFLLKSSFEYLSHYQMAVVGIRAIRQLRDDLYEHLTGLSHDYYSKGRTGDFLSRIMNDVQQIQGAITDVVFDLIKQPFVVIYLSIQIFVFGGKYALVALAIFPIVVIPITLLGKSLRRITRKMQERNADITSFIGETLSGIHIVKAFNREEYEVDRFRKINKGVFDHFKKTIRVTLIQRPLIEVLGAFGAGIAIWFSIGNLPLDRFGAFVVSLFLLYDPLKKLSKANSVIQQSMAAGARIFEILDAQPGVQDYPQALPFQGEVQEVSFEKISFSYHEDQKVLDEVSLTVKKGEVLAIVGPSGAGKTTLVSLIPRFYDPTDGAVKINQKNILDYTLHSLRNLIGIVTQETVLFNSTVRENIAYHDLEGSLQQVKRAAEAANAAEFIESLPEGYDTPLGERGMKLSGGQRQRLSIARAIFKDPPILILDEATSHLDTESEREVQTAIENLMQGRTVFVIAHRLSTIQRADRIIVVQDGRIIEQGTNDSLLQQDGAYKRLYDLQFNV